MTALRREMQLPVQNGEKHGQSTLVLWDNANGSTKGATGGPARYLYATGVVPESCPRAAGRRMRTASLSLLSLKLRLDAPAMPLRVSEAGNPRQGETHRKRPGSGYLVAKHGRVRACTNKTDHLVSCNQLNSIRGCRQVVPFLFCPGFSVYLL